MISDQKNKGYFYKEVFSTGDVAKVCRVSQQTAIRCIDEGLLKGFKIAGSRFRRVRRCDLINFMREQKLPTDLIEAEEPPRVLIAGPICKNAFELRNKLPEKTRIFEASSTFELGMIFFKVDIVILDLSLDFVKSCLKKVEELQSSKRIPHIIIFGEESNQLTDPHRLKIFYPSRPIEELAQLVLGLLECKNSCSD